MNQELTNQILKMLQSTSSFVVSQAPDVIQQYLSMQSIDYISNSIYAFLVMLIFVYLINKSINYHQSDDCPSYDDEPIQVVVFILSIIVIISGMIITSNLTGYYQITHYPKGYLMEQVMKYSNTK